MGDDSHGEGACQATSHVCGPRQAAAHFPAVISNLGWFVFFAAAAAITNRAPLRAACLAWLSEGCRRAIRIVASPTALEALGSLVVLRPRGLIAQVAAVASAANKHKQFFQASSETWDAVHEVCTGSSCA